MRMVRPTFNSWLQDEKICLMTCARSEDSGQPSQCCSDDNLCNTFLDNQGSTVS